MNTLFFPTSTSYSKTNTLLTGSDGAGILAYAGIGGDAPPLNAFEDVRAVVTDRRSNGIRALLDAIFVSSSFPLRLTVGYCYCCCRLRCLYFVDDGFSLSC